ncbi:DHA2 family efflux MFS transporter permease subunit [Solimonas marina]|uniref:DHA2 family efflux MFS transporter permease subunit n=1 Tax=Solimonas marina TaxID=2714601 RepID=A0A970B5X8_9GAMM|nr:DHA2 family efflux MFS transporter permease subunit [Solimonas marina]NKF22055.1 DHA2 family efflux MFS transporter permease subunit [Solimonas marina]
MSGKAASRGLITMSVMAATMMQALDSTIANVALPHMQGSLSAASDQISWVLTSYIVAAAIATAPTGFLARRFGLKQLFLTSIVGFTIASMLCGIATSLTEIVVFRLLQGLFGAALVPLSQTVLLDTYPPEQHGSAMSLWGMGVMLGPILGPTLGGWLTEYYSWRWVFFINLPIGIFSFLGLSATLPKIDNSGARARLDVLGFALLSIAIASLQLMLDRGETKDWFSSTEIVIEAGAAVFAFYLFFVHTMTAKKPFIPPHLFRDRNFVSGLVLIFIVGIVLFATSALLPPFLQNLRDFPVVTTGLAVAPRGVGTMIAMQAAGPLLRRVDPRKIMAVGMGCTALSLYWMAGYTLDVPIWFLTVSMVVQGFGIGFVFVPLSTVTFGTLSPQDRGDGTALFSLLRNVGSSIGIAAAFAYQTRMTQVNHAYLTEHITPYNPAIFQYLNAGDGLTKAEGLATIVTEVSRQAGMLALIADIKVMMWGVLLATPLLLLFRRPSPSAQVNEEALLD